MVNWSMMMKCEIAENAYKVKINSSGVYEVVSSLKEQIKRCKIKSKSSSKQIHFQAINLKRDCFAKYFKSSDMAV